MNSSLRKLLDTLKRVYIYDCAARWNDAPCQVQIGWASMYLRFSFSMYAEGICYRMGQTVV